MKKAFTLLELVFIIVVIGILAAVILPNTKRNTLQEAAIQLISHIRYTQHLAMIDDKFDANDANWYKKRWQLIFTNTTTLNDISYSIYSDRAGFTGNADSSEIAIDPMNRDKFLSGGSSTISQTHAKVNRKLNLGASYDITSLSLSGGCSGVRITFDHLGRPMQGTIHDSSQSYEDSNMIFIGCNITMSNGSGENIIIHIEPETGFTCRWDNIKNQCIKF